MQETFSKATIWLIVFCAFGLVEASAPQLQLQDIPPDNLSLDTIRTLSINPLLRASLEAAIKSRDYTNAETLLTKELEQQPRNPALLTFLGRILFLDGKYLASAIALKKADELVPLDNRSRFTLALSYIILGHADWARPELENLVHSNPRDPLYTYWLGRVKYREREYPQAISDFKKVLGLDPNFVKAYDRLGLCYEALGQFDEAIDIYGKAVSLNRRQEKPSPWPPLNLASLLVRIGKLEQAKSLLEESLKYDPRFPKAHCQMGILLQKENKDSDAIRELNEALKFDPSFSEPHYMLGKIYQRIGDKNKASYEWQIFEKLKKENSKDSRP